MKNELKTRPEAVIHPPVDVAELDDGVMLAMEMPGAKADAISVVVEEDTLTIGAPQADRPGGTRLLHQETSRGTYRRDFRLSPDLAREGLSADYRHGVLTVRIPKAAHSIPRRIEVATE
jgi:HSP20 family molecular chaperone IbpA